MTTFKLQKPYTAIIEKKENPFDFNDKKISNYIPRDFENDIIEIVEARDFNDDLVENAYLNKTVDSYEIKSDDKFIKRIKLKIS